MPPHSIRLVDSFYTVLDVCSIHILDSYQSVVCHFPIWIVIYIGNIVSSYEDSPGAAGLSKFFRLI